MRPCLAILATLMLAPGSARAQTAEEHHAEELRTRRPAPEAGAPDLDQVARLIVDQTNAFRAQHERKPLQLNAKLAKAAGSFAEYLARTGKFSHTADGKQPSDRVRAAGYEACIVAENIAYEYNSEGFPTEELATKLMQGWQHSPGHRRNLLDPDLTEIGVAVARSKQNGYYYAVQDFGRPHALHLVFTISNETDATVQYQAGEGRFSLPPAYTRTHEVCRPTSLTFRWPEGEPTTLRPANGTHLLITQDAGGFHVQRQE